VIVAPWRVLGILLVVLAFAWWVIRRRTMPRIDRPVHLR
jgi:hypothetical protein